MFCWVLMLAVCPPPLNFTHISRSTPSVRDRNLADFEIYNFLALHKNNYRQNDEIMPIPNPIQTIFSYSSEFKDAILVVIMFAFHSG